MVCFEVIKDAPFVFLDSRTIVFSERFLLMPFPGFLFSEFLDVLCVYVILIFFVSCVYKICSSICH